MYLTAQGLKNGVIFSREKIVKAYEDATKMYTTACDYLWQHGFIALPVNVDIGELCVNLYKRYPILRDYLVNQRTGLQVSTSKQIEYILYLHGQGVLGTQVPEDLLQILYTFFSSNEQLSSLTRIVDSPAYKRHSKQDLITVIPKFAFCRGKVHDSSIYDLNNDFLVELLAATDIVKIDYTEKFYEEVLKALNLDTSCIAEGTSCFIKDAPLLVDLYFLVDILNGNIYQETDCFKTLEAKSDTYNSSVSQNAQDICSFEQHLKIVASTKLIDFIRESVTKLGPAYKPVFMSETAVYYSNTAVNTPSNTSKSMGTSVYVGSHVKNNIDGSDLDMLNAFLGYNGDYVPTSLIDGIRYQAKGLPLTMYAYDINTRKFVANRYYASFNVNEVYKGHHVVLDSVVETKETASYERLCAFFNIDTLDNFAEDLKATGIINVNYGEHTERFKTLVCSMFQTLLCIKCNYTLPGHISPNELKLDNEDDWITREVYMQAYMYLQDCLKVFKQYLNK